LVTVTEAVIEFEELQAEMNLIVNLPFELLSDLTVKVVDPLAAMLCDAGVNLKLVRPSGWMTEIVSALITVAVKVSVEPPFFLMVIDPLFRVNTVHPEGGELLTPPVDVVQLPQGSSQVTGLVPATVERAAMSPVWLTLE
jgi:hypothetical protein